MASYEDQSSGGSSFGADVAYNDTTNDFTVTASEAGGDVVVGPENTSAAASSGAVLRAKVASGSTGSPKLTLDIDGGTAWHIINRNDLTDSLEIVRAAAKYVSIRNDAEAIFFGPTGAANTNDARQVLFAHWNAAGGILSGPSIQSQQGANEMLNIIPGSTGVAGAPAAGKGLAAYSHDSVAGNYKRAISYVHRAGPPELFLCRDGGDTILGGDGSTAIATTATTGFPRMPHCAGVPTGAAADGSYIRDSVNHKVYVMSGGTWRILN